MEYNDLLSAVEQLGDELAIIRYRSDPSREILADIEYCARWKGIGSIYFFRVDKETLTYGEGLVKMQAEDVVELRKSGIPTDGLSSRRGTNG